MPQLPPEPAQDNDSAERAAEITGRHTVRAARIQARAGIIGALIGAVGLIGVNYFAPESKTVELLLPRPTVTVTEQPSPTPSATTSPSPSVAPGQVVYLDDLEPIEARMDSETATFGAADFPHSLVNPLASCSAVEYVEWILPAAAKTLVVEIGVDPASPEAEAKVSFEILMAGQPILQKTLAVGEHESASLPVKGAARIRFVATIDEDRRGNCNTEARAIWGSAHVIVS